jgi:RimJ/RimL family protein N-acetyltransferase
MSDAKLPSAFAELEDYAQIWCLPTEDERWNKRLASSMLELHAFHDAFFPRLEDAIEYCDKFPLDDIPDDAVNLLHLIYSLVMVAMAVEVFGQQMPTDAADAVMTRVGEPVP